MGGRCAVAVAVAVWCGLLLGVRARGPAIAAALGLALPLSLLAWRATPRVGTVCALLALVLAAVARSGASRATLERARADVASTAAAGRPLFRLAGRVVEPPQRESGEPIAIVEVRAADPPLVAGTRVRLRLPAESAAEWSDGIEALALLEVPPAIRNPGGYDALASADAACLAAAGRAYDATSSPARGPAAWPRATVARWRRAIERRLAARLSPEARELVAPLMLGDRSALSPVLNARFRASGLIHLLALSGLHVAWMAAIARGAAAALGRGVGTRAVAGALCALGYVGVAGPIPSLVRAAATEVLYSVARGSGRALDAVQALALGAVALLLLAPGWSGDLGFQLSCAATLGLVTIGPALAGSEGRWRRWREAFVPTASAQLTAMPLLLHRFHALSWVAPLSNLVAVPISGLLLTGAWLAVGLDLAAPGLGGPWFGACEALGLALRAVTESAAAAPTALFAAGGEPAVALLAAIGAALLAIGCPPPRDLVALERGGSPGRVAGIAAGVLASALALLLAASARPLAPRPGGAWVVVLDVGQGDAIALGFEDGWWLVDAGPRSPRYDAGESVVLPFARWAGIRGLDAMVLTHDDGDHAGGAGAVERELAAKRVWVPPPFPGAPGPGRRFASAAVARGSLLRRDPPVKVLWPPAPAAAPEPDDGGGRAAGAGAPGGKRGRGSGPAGEEEPPIASDNDAGLVLEVGEGSARSLLLADVDSTVEARLAVVPEVALLKVAHHGSGTSSGAGFVARLRPRVAAISCGRRNPFGHPDRGALDRLRAAGARIHRTDQSGALWFEVTSEGARMLDWRRGEQRRVESVAVTPWRAADARAPRAP